MKAFLRFIYDSLEALVEDDRPRVERERLEQRQKRWLRWLYNEP